jgi:hypothetical protein
MSAISVRTGSTLPQQLCGNVGGDKKSLKRWRLSLLNYKCRRDKTRYFDGYFGLSRYRARKHESYCFAAGFAQQAGLISQKGRAGARSVAAGRPNLLIAAVGDD